jgi:hypothetical protein
MARLTHLENFDKVQQDEYDIVIQDRRCLQDPHLGYKM